MVSDRGTVGQALRNDFAHFALSELFDPFRVEQSLHGSFRGFAPTAIHVHPLRGWYLFSGARTFLSAATSERQHGEIYSALSAKNVAADRNVDRNVRTPR